MVARDDLHRLIRQMSPAEVRYFKRHARQNARNNDNKSLLLFEAIAQMPEYDETALRQSLGDEAMVRQLSVAKGYLHELLLRLLGDYHSQKGIAAQLRTALAQVEILFAKGLMEDAKRRVEKAYHLAQRFDQLHYALELLRWHSKLLKKTGTREDYRALLQLQQEETILLNDLMSESELRKAHDEILAGFSLGMDAAQHQVAEILEEVLARPFLAQLPAQLRFNSALILHYIHIYASQYRRDLPKAQYHYQQMIDLWESHPWRMAEEMERYVITVITYLQISYQSFDHPSFTSALKKLRQIMLPRSMIAAQAFHYSYLLELMYAIDTGDAPFSPDMELQIQKGLNDYGNLMDPGAVLSFYSNLAIFHLLHSNHTRSLQWINLIYNSKDQTLRKDIRAFASCLRIVLQFELGDLDLVGYSLQSSRRNLQRQKDQHPLQVVMVRHLQRIVQKPADAQAGEWEEFHHVLSTVAREYQEGLSGIKALLTWVEGKAKGRSMLEVVRGL